MLRLRGDPRHMGVSGVWWFDPVLANFAHPLPRQVGRVLRLRANAKQYDGS